TSMRPGDDGRPEAGFHVTPPSVEYFAKPAPPMMAFVLSVGWNLASCVRPIELIVHDEPPVVLRAIPWLVAARIIEPLGEMASRFTYPQKSCVGSLLDGIVLASCVHDVPPVVDLKTPPPGRYVAKASGGLTL